MTDDETYRVEVAERVIEETAEYRLVELTWPNGEKRRAYIYFD